MSGVWRDSDKGGSIPRSVVGYAKEKVRVPLIVVIIRQNTVISVFIDKIGLKSLHKISDNL